jgi:secreted trypsin-like serine protease
MHFQFWYYFQGQIFTRHFYGGSVISVDWVLMAAHCVDGWDQMCEMEATK